MKTVYITNLGCKVNQYESQALRKRFRDAGWQVCEKPDGADACVINTCSVTAIADRKSRQIVRQCRAKSPGAVIAVTGCYAQTGTEAVCAMEEADIVCGTNRKNAVFGLVEEALAKRSPDGGCDGPGREKVTEVLPYEEITGFEEMGPVVAMEGRTRAYIKIQEGCNRFCSYCIIPYARGQVRSRSADSIIEEAKLLIDAGYREIVLTGINTALYGADDGGESRIEEIIERLDALEGEFRIRLSSLEPTVINAGYIKRLFRFDRLCHHVHLSLQSGSDDVLRSMNRLYTCGEYREIVRVIKEFDENYGITTDIIVGFPGESEAGFEESVKICDEVDFCRVHGFKYSARSGTPAAEAEKDKKLRVSPETKQERAVRLAEAAAASARRFVENNLGTSRVVLFEEIVDTREGKFLTGLTDNYLRVYLPVAGGPEETGPTAPAGNKSGEEAENEASSLINSFGMVLLDQPLLDGILGILL